VTAALQSSWKTMASYRHSFLIHWLIGPSTLCSVFLSCLVHLWIQTPRSSPTGCHPSYRCAQIIWVSYPWSFASHYFLCQAFVLYLHLLFSLASACGGFFCNISFQMPSMSLCLSSSASWSRMHIIEARSSRQTLQCWVSFVCWCAAVPYLLESGHRSSCSCNPPLGYLTAVVIPHE